MIYKPKFRRFTRRTDTNTDTVFNEYGGNAVKIGEIKKSGVKLGANHWRVICNKSGNVFAGEYHEARNFARSYFGIEGAV